MARRHRGRVALPLLVWTMLLGIVTSAHAGSSGGATGPLPDLAPLPPRGLFVGVNEEPYFPLQSQPLVPVVKFSTHIANRGPASLETLGTPSTEPLAMEANQCVGWYSSRVCAERRSAGRIVWHDRHQHWHFDDFAIYELRRLDEHGRPDFTESGLATTSTKASFCLEDSGRENEEPHNNEHYYRTCTGLLQGISPGWVDIYSSGLPGQWVSIDGVPDGRYAVVVTVDPLERLSEADRSNNVAWTVIELLDGGREVRELGTGAS